MKYSPLMAPIFASLLLSFGLAGCIGNPEAITYCGEQECGDTNNDLTDTVEDDTDGGEDIEDDTDGGEDIEDDTDGGEEDPTTECIITASGQSGVESDPPAPYTSIQMAYEDGCDIIFIDRNAPAPLYLDDGTQPDALLPLEISRKLAILPLEDLDSSFAPDARAQIIVPAAGLFQVTDQGSLTLNGIEFLSNTNPDPASESPPTSGNIIYIDEEAELIATNISFDKFILDSDNALLYIAGDATLEQVEITKSGHVQSNHNTGLIHIVGGNVDISESIIRDNTGLKSAAIQAIGDATLNMSASEISNNEIINVAQVHGAGIFCEGSQLSILGQTTINNNTIEFQNGIEEEIELRGSGGYLNNCSLTIESSEITGNEINYHGKNKNETDRITLEGAGLFLENSPLISNDLRVTKNSINATISIEYEHYGHRAGGAGILIKNNQDNAIFDQATIYRNSINVSGSGQRDISTSAGGLGFITTDQARLEVVNSTISNNSIKGTRLDSGGKGTGLYLSGPGFLPPEDDDGGNSGGGGTTCRLLSFLCFVNASTNNNNNDTAHLLAILRYTTIAFNEGENVNSIPDYAAIHVDKTAISGTEAVDLEAPIISMIGLLLVSQIEKDNTNYDNIGCSGEATIIPRGTGPDSTAAADIEYGSESNYIDYYDLTGASVDSNEHNCHNIFGFTDAPSSLDLRELVPDEPNGIYTPDRSLRDSGKGPCIGLKADIPFVEDQLGQTRPIQGSTKCYPGAIEPQNLL